MSISGWTNYGPLTTAFVPPVNCTVLTMYFSPTPTPVEDAWYTPTPTGRLLIFDPALEPSCFPTEYPTRPPGITSAPTPLSSGSEPSYPFTTNGYFSPGRCPSGWGTRTLHYSFIPKDNKLAACCPPGYNHWRSRKGKQAGTACSSYLPTSSSSVPFTAVTALANGSMTTMSPQQWNVLGGVKAGKTVTAHGINVMWRLGDFPDIDAAEAVAATATPTQSQSQSSSSSESESQPPALNNGAKIAIGVGILMAAIFAGVIAFLIWNRKQDKKGRNILIDAHMRFRQKSAQGRGSDGMQPEDGGLLAFENSPRNSSQPVKPYRELMEGVVPSGSYDISSASVPAADLPMGEENPPPYTPAEPSATEGEGQRHGVETDIEYEERRLRERKQLLLERIQLAREEDAFRARTRGRS